MDALEFPLHTFGPGRGAGVPGLTPGPEPVPEIQVAGWPSGHRAGWPRGGGGGSSTIFWLMPRLDLLPRCLMDTSKTVVVGGLKVQMLTDVL